MEVKNCRGCGVLFNYLSGPQLCQVCARKLEDKFAQVKEFIEENPGASITLVAEENDVSTRQIEQWVREERLFFAEGSAYGIDCERCGKTIKTGRFCDECKVKMTQSFQRAIHKDAPKIEPSGRKQRDRDKMRFLEK